VAGIGYYTRARNLHKCANAVVRDYDGHFPNNYQALLKLPGIGTYTAAAIASIAFLEPVAVVDGNVFRVLARVFGIDDDISTPDGKHRFFSFANELISKTHPDDFNQGMMEFGATWCLPVNPKCSECIFRRSCAAFALKHRRYCPSKASVKKYEQGIFITSFFTETENSRFKDVRAKTFGMASLIFPHSNLQPL